MTIQTKRTRITDILATGQTNNNYVAKGWVRSFRSNRFIALYDGSDSSTLQIVVPDDAFSEDLLKKVTFHSCIAVSGKLVESEGAGQAVELVAESIEILGETDPEEYPLQRKAQSMEFLREHAHLRMRTNTMSTVFRVRHALTFAIHKFFQEKGFYNVNTPVITGSDAEGAGEAFAMTGFDLANVPKNDKGEVDYEKDFFGKAVNLTVTGQLQAEAAALALGQVYTFGPTFRAEKSNTWRHLAEFWMLEPEVAFADMHENMDLMQEFCQYIIQYVLDNNIADIEFLDKKIQDAEKNMKKEDRREMGLLESLQFVAKNDFTRISYTEAIEHLLNSKPHKKGKFEFPVEWGIDLASEHERWLVEKKFNQPVMVYDYPKDIKAFYMRLNDDNKTVAATDVLFPGIGEMIGGSEREDRLSVLEKRAEAMGIDMEELDWYLDLRRFGGCTHSGFGLGFERMVMFVTGMTNIRDVAAFPRATGNADF